jgi:hypothetical protein
MGSNLRSRLGTRRHSWTGIALALLACASLNSPLSAQSPPPPPDAQSESPIAAFGTWGTWAALAVQDGRIILLDVTDGRRFEWQAPSTPVLALAVIPPVDDTQLLNTSAQEADSTRPTPESGPVPQIVLGVPVGKGRKSQLFILDGSTGESLQQARVHSTPVYILPSAGAKEIYIITREVPEIIRKRQKVAARKGWALVRAIFGKTTKRMAVATSIGGDVLGAAISPEGSRIYVAQKDHIRTYVTGPLRSSWMLRSPGMNRSVVPFVSGKFLVGRDRELAIFDPENLPGRDSPSGKISRDDSVDRVKLPIEARAVSVSHFGTEAAILDANGRKMILLDFESRQVRQVKELPATRAAVFHPERAALFLFSPDGGLAEMILTPSPVSQVAARRAPASSMGAGAEAAEAVRPDLDPAPASAPVVANETRNEESGRNDSFPDQPSSAVSPPEAALTHSNEGIAESSPEVQPLQSATSTGTEPANSPDNSVEVAVESAQPVPENSIQHPPASSPEAAPEPGVGSETPAGTPPAAENLEKAADFPKVIEREPLYVAPVPALRGTFSGEIGLISELILYGPNAILREHSRISVSPEGKFEAPIPPPGRYRLVPQGLDGAQLVTSPPLHRFTVGSKPLPALDFNVRGKVRGNLRD